MNIKENIQKVKGFTKDKKDRFKDLKKEKKIAIIIGTIAIILAMIFGVKYANDNKYGVLFSGLDTNDAASITKELESKNIDTKIKGDSIYVPKADVDKLRLELSGSISNGSKGFEIMDETSSFGLTDEEFEIKKQRMLQGEIEKTIKTFDQVENARVHITKGEESVFSKEGVEGTAAIYLNLKPGSNLDAGQVRSIVSLVSASSTNIPKQNVEVIDQNMNLLSEGLFDENGNKGSNNSNGVDVARKAEKDLNSDLERSITGLLEPIFGEGNVKAKVNADLNFDSNEKTEVIIDPNKVIKKEFKSENKSTEAGGAAGAVDNNMNNVGNAQKGLNESKEENIEYDTGKVETKTITAQGEVKRITASVAIDGVVGAGVIKKVEDMVANTVGMDDARGDDVKVVAMDFDKYDKNAQEEGKEVAKVLKTTGYVVGGLLVLIVISLIAMFIIKKRRNAELDYEEDVDSDLELINKKLEEMDKDRANGTLEEEEEQNITLEEEVRNFASENPDKVTELINSWLND